MKTINLIAFAIMVVMNYLANALPLNGKTTGQLSDQYPNLFTPAGLTFSIWGVIYLMLLGFVVLQFRDGNKSMVSAIGWAFALSCLLNASWILAWHYEALPFSLIIMLALLAVLIFINVKLQPFAPGWIKAAFGIYLGWICIATIANITALLVSYNWGGWGISQPVWAMIMVLAGAFITSWALFRLDNPFLGLAALWAILGIVIKQHGSFPQVASTAIMGMIIVTISIFLWMGRKAI